MKELGRMLLVLAVVCVAAALGLARVYDLTAEPIREAKREEILRALRVVLPPFDNAPDRDVVESGDGRFLPGRKAGRLTGVGIPVSTMEGYGGLIEALVGVDPDGRVQGVAILSHAETPGLGSKFTNPEFLSQFRGRSLGDANWGVKKDGGEFDQITGATITPRALVKAIKAGLEAYAGQRERIAAGAEGQP